MSSPSHYDDYFRSHLPKEQRRAVLEVLAEELDPETTMGEVIDAAEDLGWGDALGELNLEELAAVLVSGGAEELPVVGLDRGGEVEADDEVETDEDEDEDEVEAVEVEAEEPEEEAPPVSVWRGRKVSAKSKKAAAKKTAKSAAAKKTAAKKTGAKKAGAKKAGAKKVSAKKAGAKKVSAKTASAKKVSAKKVSAKTASAKTASAKKTGAKKTGAKKTGAKKTGAKKTGAKSSVSAKTSKASAKKSASGGAEEEALSLDQAAKLLVPIVRRLKEATMQELEERTGMGRRKLRFHIGQLVKNGYLKRHGMGRGTHYTTAKR